MRKFPFILLAALATPILIMWIGWLLAPAHPVSVVIVDKTVMSTDGSEHRSFNWVLTHLKFSKLDGQMYSVSRDYQGFFPREREHYTIAGLEQMTDAQVDKLAAVSDAAYYTDTYGVYYNEWYQSRGLPIPPATMERSQLIYGGLHEHDLRFLDSMKSQSKLILTEFNFLGSPTPRHLRERAEQMFGLHWSGWTGKYFDSFDTTENADLPQWLVRRYQASHGGAWPFHRAGVGFIHESDSVVVLEDQTHLIDVVPSLVTQDSGQARFGVPRSLPYPYWIDVMAADTSSTVISFFYLHPNASGDSLLQRAGIPKVFPAVIERIAGYRFYYFAGDFADNPIKFLWTAQLKGVTLFKTYYYDHAERGNRRKFFWEYYLPLVSTILENYDKERFHR